MKISKYLNISIFVILFVSGLLFVPGKVEAVPTTRTVCPNPVGSCSPSDPSFVGADGIVAAITASTDGDTVSIKNGTYSGFTTPYLQSGKYFFINLTKNITITGESTAGTILSGAVGNNGSMFLINNTAASTISNLTITGGVNDCGSDPCSKGNGIEINGTGTETLSLTNLKIYGNAGVGIFSGGSSKVNVTNNTIYSNGNGIWVSVTSNQLISGTTIYENFEGIVIYNNATATISSSTIRQNTDDAIRVANNAVIVMNNNNIYSNAGIGLQLHDSSQVTGTGNSIYSNTYATTASGVYCTDTAVLGTWTNNNVWNNTGGNYGSIPPELCPNKTGTNGNISVDPQSLLSSSSSSLLPETALREDSFLKIFISFLAICIGIIFLSRHFATISKEDN